MIKLGRMKLRVKELRTPSEADASVATQDSSDDEQDAAAGQCRICLSDEPEPDNPLIAPCNCSGSMKYIHLNCLWYWLEVRRVMWDSPNALLYYWKSIDCEVCQHTYPLPLLTKWKGCDLFPHDLPSRPCVILESLKGSLSLFLFSLLKTDCVKVGRGHEADVRISDISVSRSHATITFAAGHFGLVDTGSKFGSLVLAPESVVLEAGQRVVVQVGRSVITLARS